MTHSTADSSPLAVAQRHHENVTTLTQHVHDLIDSLQPDLKSERRHYDRSPIPYLFRLTPLDGDGQPLMDQTRTVVGRDISARGMSFFHEQPLLFRRAIVSLDHPDALRFTAEIDIRWCRFAKVGWYASGGRLLRAVGDLEAG
jgi:hypothetical protein